MVRSFILDRHRVLDLGAGAGRIADPLAESGHNVVAVDESAEMLAHIRHASTVLAPIEAFRCEERFDAVLLLSHLINTSDDARRQALLDTVAAHLAPDGLAVIQRHDPARRVRVGGAELGSVHIALTDLDDTHWPAVRATTHYRLGDRSWNQPWEAVVLNDDATRRVLLTGGLRPLRIDGPWVTAVSTPATS